MKITDVDCFLSSICTSPIGCNDLVIRYGSHDATSDIDLLIVSNTQGHYKQLNIGRLDIVMVPIWQAETMALNLDLLLIEPLLSGVVLNCNTSMYDRIMHNINSPNPWQIISKHYLLQSMRCRLSSETYFARMQNGDNKNDMSDAAFLLSWTCSYYFGAQIYRRIRSSKIVRFEDVINEKNGQLLLRARAIGKKAQKNEPDKNIQKINAIRNDIDKLFY